MVTKHSSEPHTRLSALCKTREEMEAAERAILAPFAEKSGDSRGRRHAEPSHSFRTEFQRDRARIIHSRAFRRLEYKTQVFLNGTGDHLRTRLTHSIEVASISRTIARALRLNEDLAEAIRQTNATLAFDAIGGGRMASLILSTIEAVAVERMTV